MDRVWVDMGNVHAYPCHALAMPASADHEATYIQNVKLEAMLQKPDAPTVG